MRFLINILALLLCGFVSSQDEDKVAKESQNLVYSANAFFEEDNFTEAEMEYRKAISKAPSKTVGAYNLSHSYYKKGKLEEALYRGQEAVKNAKTKKEKYLAYHNLGNYLMKKKDCKTAAEAFKNALRNNPHDEETRYNFALAKECAEQQKQDGGGEDNKEDKNKDQEQDKKDNQNKDNKKKNDEGDEGDKDKKDGDKDEDEDGKPKDDEKDKNNQGQNDNENKDNQKPKPQPGQLSPQQIKNILEAMQNQEQKVQEKINAEKQKGVKVKTDKDW